jgi:hypothetical protein
MSNLNEAQFGDYHMSHRPAGPGNDSGAPFHQADEVMPDVTGPKGPQFYDSHNYAIGPGGRPSPIPHSQSPSAESFAQIRAAKDNPEAPVNIYRAVPKVEHGINAGDWVTPSRKYAEMHASNEGLGAVVTGQAKAGELWGHGDDVNEWGYHPHSQS